MLGGPGWSADSVSRFLGSYFFCTPCGAVPKKDYPYGRIIHNYSHKIDGISLNDCLVDNSTEYISFKGCFCSFEKLVLHKKLEVGSNNRSVMPLDVLGSARATIGE